MRSQATVGIDDRADAGGSHVARGGGDAERPGTGKQRAGEHRRASRASWLIGPWMLTAVLCGALLVLRGPDRVFGGALALFLGASIAWILVSVLWPARPDRTCPACGEEALRRMDPETTRGVACSACGHRDETQSSFLMAEEEGDAVERIRLSTRSTERPERR